MKRSEKYQDTKFFKFYNANFNNKYTDDCVIRALSNAMGISYNDVLIDLFNIYLKYGYSLTDNKCFEKYLKINGWKKHKQPRKLDNTKLNGIEFILEICNRNENYIVNIGSHHITSIVNNKIYDTWDCSEFKVGNYWTK